MPTKTQIYRCSARQKRYEEMWREIKKREWENEKKGMLLRRLIKEEKANPHLNFPNSTKKKMKEEMIRQKIKNSK